MDIQNHNPNTTSTNTTDDNSRSNSNDDSVVQQSLHSNTSPVQSYRNYRLLGLFVIDQLIEKSSPSR